MDFAKVSSEFYEEFLDMYPSIGSSLGHRKYDDRYENGLSKSLSLKWKYLVLRYLKRAVAAHDQSIQSKAFKWFLHNEIRQYNNLWLIPITSFDNIITSAIFANKSFYPIFTKHDVKNLTSRYTQMVKVIKTCISTMKEGIRRKVVLPRMICRLLIKDLKKHYKDKEYIIHVRKELVSDDYNKVLNEYSISLSALITFLENEYVPRCRNTLGICYLPSGKANYAKLVVSETTLQITPEEIFEFGLKEVNRLLQEFDKVKHQLGYHNLDHLQFCKTVMSDPRHYAKDVDKLITEFESQRTRIRNTVIRDYFHHAIKETYYIKSVPADMQESSVAAFYYAGNYTKKKKGVEHVNGTFYLNTRNLDENPLYSAYVLSLHEGEPGHHYQFQYMIEKKLPEYNIFAFNSNGFVEGWALYAETLGDYSPLEMFGKLTYEMLRAVRLVVDVGVHYYGWNWKKALTYMKKNIPMKQSELESELIRYICIPGQAVSYKIGERLFKQLRVTYLCSNGDKTIKDFHEAVLENGILPLEVLKENFRINHKAIV